MPNLICTLMACLSLSTSLSAQASAQASALDAIAAQALASGQAPGFAYAVLDAGAVVLARGYGLAEVAGGLKVTPQTRFAIGSLSKQFTAAAVLKLVQAGAIGLDAPVEGYVPGLPNGDAITVRMLLNQTSGLHTYPSTTEHAWPLHGAIAPAQLLAILKTDKPDFAPGERFAYSNTNYCVLAMVVAKASGESYGDYLQRAIFSPLGMTGSGSGYAAQAGTAVPYTHGERAEPTSLDLYLGAGSVVSTAQDMLRWDQALLDGTVLAPQQAKLLWSQGMTSSGAPTGYAMGFVPARLDGRQEVWHNGLTPGAGGYTFNAIFPEDRLAVIVLSNGMEFRPQPEHMVQATLEALVPAARTAAASTQAASTQAASTQAGATQAGATAPQAAPPAPADPAAVAKARALALTIYTQMRQGKVDPALLTPQMQAGFTSEKLASMAPVFQQLGDPVSLTLDQQHSAAGGVSYTFLTRFASATLHVTIFLTAEGKVGGYFLKP